jgi:glutamate/tyrosine decarboxylase-like PLP-dependent enzyme
LKGTRVHEKPPSPPGSALPPPASALFPPADERRRIDDWLTRSLAEAHARIQRGAVTPSLDAAAFLREIEAIDFNEPRPLEELLRFGIERLEHGIVQMSNPRYFGLFNPGANFPSQCADRIVALFNPQLASSASSPVPVALEGHLIRAVARRAGLRADAGGHFATGGSEANYTALLCALTAAHPAFAQDGARAFPGRPMLYASHDCHIAWLKIAHQAGIGRASLRLVGTDGKGRMDPAALERAIADDRKAGAIPVLVVATAGTTGGGMIDPLGALADVARREGAWYHVDAAWGGAALASERMRGLLAGIERADSITIDAHKWFATTMGCAMYITARKALLSEVFHASTSFMPSSVAAIDPYLNSVQWSRRFLGLRLFLSLGAAGWEGLGAHVERAVAVVSHVERKLVALGWTVANASPLGVLDVIPPSTPDVRALVRRVVASGRAWVAPATFEGRDVVRICATNGEVSEADIETLVAALTTAASQACAEPGSGSSSRTESSRG